MIEKLRELLGQTSPLELPIGMYVVTRSGNFVDCNNHVREILQLAPDQPLPESIEYFYWDPDERKDILKEMEEKLQNNPEEWMEKLIRFRVGGRMKLIKDYSRAIFESKGAPAIGFLCCMIDVTEEEFYNRLYQSLPAGLYQLDENNKVAKINQAAVEMLGYGTKSEIIGKPLKEFFLDADEEENFMKLVNEGSRVADQRVELQKRTGEPMFVSLSAFRVLSSDDEYIGQEGTMIDVTTEERYLRILRYGPVGLYVVTETDGKDIITDCNEQFASLTGFDRTEDAIGFDAKLLHTSEQSYEEYMRELATSGDEPLHDYRLQIRTKKGKEAVFDISSRLLYNRSGRRIGRVGAMRDVTDRANLEQKVQELTDDIGRILHTYSTAYVKMQNAINYVLRSFGPDPFVKGFNLLPERASAELAEPGNQLANAINILVGMSTSQWGASALPQEKWDRLRELSQMIQNYRQNFPYPESHPPTLRAATFEVLAILDELQKGRLSKDTARQVRASAQEVLRICNIISLRQLIDLTLAMEQPVAALREFVIADRRQKESRVACTVSSLVSQAVNNLNDFALNRGVGFRYRMSAPNATVEVNERDIVRAFDNLLHNAIKYSWERKRGEAPWISIRTNVRDNKLYVEFENWGVPIPKDERETGLIFRTGFRGRLSSDRGRSGTGIGLADALMVARAHGGELLVNSEPAVFGRSDDDYKQPFRTTATIILPITSKQGEVNEA